MLRTPGRRTAAVVLSVLVPLGAVSACGAQKRATIEQEFQSAGDAFSASRSLSFALSLRDDDGNLSKAATKGKDGLPQAIAGDVLGARIAVVLDPAGDRTFADLQKLSGTPVKEQVKAFNAAIAVEVAGGPLVELRLVDGTAYGRVDFGKVDDLAVKAGKGKPSAALDDAPAELAPAARDLRAGRWLALPLDAVVEQFAGLVPTPSATPSIDPEVLGGNLLAAVRPFVTVTDAGGDRGERVLDVRVRVREAVKALLPVLAKQPGIGDLLPDGTSGKVDKAVGTGEATGKVVLKAGRLTKVELDLESVVALDTNNTVDPLTGGFLVLDVDDSADEVRKPSDVSDVDVAGLFKSFFGVALGSFGASGSGAVPGGGFPGVSPQARKLQAELLAAIQSGDQAEVERLQKEFAALISGG